VDSPTPDVFATEQAKLQDVLHEINRQHRKLSTTPRYYGDDILEQSLDDIRQRQLRNLTRAQPEPYFGRLDFQPTGEAERLPLYIGKIGVQDVDTSTLLTVDWRAPVASLFYSFTGQDDAVSYESPDGMMEGTVHLKRNLSIRKAELQRVVDSYVKGQDNLAVTDEFLLYRLGENKDNRLRDIVSTIQKEQDAIIRAPREKALVIQGVAGSGKTTVALHRLAFLLYQYHDRIRAERMMIFAPNTLFLDYISNVLPELGVGDIKQTTFQKWAVEILGDEIVVADRTQLLQTWFSPTATDSTSETDVAQTKGLLDFRNRLHQFMTRMEPGMFPDTDFAPWDGYQVKKEVIRTWFEEEYHHLPIMERRERVLARVRRTVEAAWKEISGLLAAKDYKKQMSQRLKAYAKLWPQWTPYDVYQTFLETCPDVSQSITSKSSTAVTAKAAKSKSHQAGSKRRVIAVEDLPPLVYLHDWLFGVPGTEWFHHVVVDEAQDFSQFQVSLLRDRCPSHSFTLLGDLSQNIFSFQGISTWDDMLKVFPEETGEFHYLHRSYRSTMEIIQFANTVLERSGEDLPQATPVFRSGEPVDVRSVADAEIPVTLAQAITAARSRGIETAAVITRTEADALKLHAQLQVAGLDTHLVEAHETNYQGGISVLPVHLAKGLEFDAVWLPNVSNLQYRTRFLDAKLLYVACTRALHELHVWYDDSPSALINV